MSEKMNWKDLLSAKRWGYEDRTVGDPLDARSEFQRDYDRLIFFFPISEITEQNAGISSSGSGFCAQ